MTGNRPTGRQFLPILAIAAVVAIATSTAQNDFEYPHGDYESDCERCHSDEHWVPAEIGDDFDHRETGFPLVASHETANCRGCHPTLEFAEADPNCVSCHLDAHRGELGADCARCHTPRSFIDRTAMVRAHVATRMPLRGAHLPVDCEDCHTRTRPGQYRFVNTPTQCEACHLPLYYETTDPDHQANGFPTDCALCHRPTSWDQGRFNHGTVTAPCVTCHLDDYQNTTDPDHEANGFPTDCRLCHRPGGSWDRTSDGLNHDAAYFPIYSGRHRNRWSACSDCHLSPNNFADFSCLQCHEHSDRSGVESDHSGVSGFVYDSQACYSCHPRGES